MSFFLKKIKIIILLLLTCTSALQADEMDVFCYSENTDSWDWITAEDGGYLSFEGEKRKQYNESRHEYFYYVSIPESLYSTFLADCPIGSVPQPVILVFLIGTYLMYSKVMEALSLLRVKNHFIIQLIMFF